MEHLMKPWQSVVMRRAWDIRPVFHRTDRPVYETSDMLDPDATEKHSLWTTACGLLLEELRWIERRADNGYEQREFVRTRIDWTWLRFDNAESFGRPCGNCFRDPAPDAETEETAGV